MLITPDSELGPGLLGRDMKVTIHLGGTTEKVLAVPFSAVRSGAGGASFVEVQEGEDTRRLSVTTGLIADGWVEIIDSDPQLHPGDVVVLSAESGG